MIFTNISNDWSGKIWTLLYSSSVSNTLIWLVSKDFTRTLCWFLWRQQGQVCSNDSWYHPHDFHHRRSNSIFSCNRKFKLKIKVFRLLDIVFLFSKNIKYLLIHAHDSPQQNIYKFFEESIEFIHKARTSGGAVFVHCRVGMSRSVTLVIAYIMSSNAKSFSLKIIIYKVDPFFNLHYFEKLLSSTSQQLWIRSGVLVRLPIPITDFRSN